MSSRNSYKLDQVGIRMVKEPPLYSSEPVNSPEAAVRIIADTLRNYDREVFCVVNLRNDLKPINVNVVSVGTLNASIAHPREILKSTILSNAAAVMLLHNHPSGNLTPSREDIELTARMQEICTMLGTPVQDHIIVGNDDRYFSFREQDILQIARPLDKDLSDINLKGVAESESRLQRLSRTNLKRRKDRLKRLQTSWKKVFRKSLKATSTRPGFQPCLSSTITL